MRHLFYDSLQDRTAALHSSGLYKSERVISSPQQASISIIPNQHAINLCANNYLGLANHPLLVECAQAAIQQYGFGMASVRFICGTHYVHTQLEKHLCRFLSTEACMLFSSCFDANGGIFDALLSEEDAIFSDAFNHASIIDGIRLCKAQRFRYKNNDMLDLAAQLQKASHARFKLIVTDGVFSMDGSIAQLVSICDLAEQYGALVMVDDSHATGFMGAHGKGTHEYCDVMTRVDILSGTFGKALGGASGGYIAGKKTLIDWLKQHARPYLFSNALPPFVAATTIKALQIIETSPELQTSLQENAYYFRKELSLMGFTLIPGEHPIIPVMIGDPKLATIMADALLKQGIYVIGFSYPVVPMGKARIRTQMSATLTRSQLDKALHAFQTVGKKLAIIS